MAKLKYQIMVGRPRNGKRRRDLRARVIGRGVPERVRIVQESMEGPVIISGRISRFKNEEIVIPTGWTIR